MSSTAESATLKEYDVIIKETLQRTVTIEASDAIEAEQIVQDQWDASIHILGSDDFTDVKFEASGGNRELSLDASINTEGGEPKLATENLAAQLRENEHISQLYKILQDHGKDVSGLSALLGYVSDMEKHVKSVENKITDMKAQLEEIKEIHNHPIKTTLQNAIKKLETKVVIMNEKISKLKASIIAGSKSAVSAFKDRGISAISNLASFFKIRRSLENWDKEISSMISTDEKTMAKIKSFSIEYHSTGRHLKNMARVAVGKAPKDTAKEAGKLSKAISAPYRANISVLKRLKVTIGKSIKKLVQLENNAREKNADRATDKKPTMMDKLQSFKERSEREHRELPPPTRARAQGLDL